MLAQAQKEHAALLALARARDNKRYQDLLAQKEIQNDRKIGQYNRQVNHMMHIKDMIISEQSGRLDNAVKLFKFFEVDNKTLGEYVGFRPKANSDSEDSF